MATASEAAAPFRAPPAAERLLAGLTAEQAHAVRHGPGVLLIVAGPGAGKTKTLIHPIAFLLAQGLAEPREILAVTFRVRAASELRLRLAELLGEHVAAQVTAATFHSICARLLRDHAQIFGRDANWTIYDQLEVREVIDWLLSDRQRTEVQQGLADFGQPASSEVLHEISLAKNRLLTPQGYEQATGHPAAPLIAAVWRETDAELRRSNAMDFDDLLVCAVGCSQSTRTTWSSTGAAGRGSWSTSTRTPATRRRCSSRCSRRGTATSRSSPTTTNRSTRSGDRTRAV
jgi:DNA helicase II / ATP-dependent DNA helicase PcrA